MVFNFQVIFRLPAWNAPQALVVEAETKEAAAQRIRDLYADEKNLLVSVGPATEPPWFADLRIRSTGATAEEAQQFLNLSRTGYMEAQMRGVLRRPKTTRGLCSHTLAEMSEVAANRTEYRITEKNGHDTLKN